MEAHQLDSPLIGYVRLVDPNVFRKQKTRSRAGNFAVNL